MRIRLLTGLSAQRSLIALVLLGILIGFGNAGAVVVCLGEDGHIEVVPASTGHCCECPSNATAHNTGHPCGSCFDIPLPLGSATEFLPPAGGKVQQFKGRAEYVLSSRSLTAIAAGLAEAPPAGASYADHIPLASLATVVLLI
jgi:hypothetical protein